MTARMLTHSIALQQRLPQNYIKIAQDIPLTHNVLVDFDVPVVISIVILFSDGWYRLNSAPDEAQSCGYAFRGCSQSM